MPEYFNYLCFPSNVKDYLDHVTYELTAKPIAYYANVSSYANAFNPNCVSLCYKDPCDIDPCGKHDKPIKDECGFDNIVKKYGTGNFGCLYGCCADPYSTNWGNYKCANWVNTLANNQYVQKIESYLTPEIISNVIPCDGLVKL